MKSLLCTLCAPFFLSIQSADAVTSSQNATTAFSYNELTNPASKDPKQWAKVKKVQIGWGSTDTRYKKEEPALSTQKQLKLHGWRGERLSAQFVVSTPEELPALTFELSDLKHTGDSKSLIAKDQLQSGFVRYVMTDELNKDKKGGCGLRPNTAAYDSSLVADPIDHLTASLDLEGCTTQGGWVTVAVPEDCKPGRYVGTVKVSDANNELATLKLELEVNKRTLPQPEAWSYHLDLWQNPYATARIYNVEPFSEAHFEAMRPDMELYARAGGKSITTSIMHKPWNGQTYDHFESMVTWLKKADGTWYYDYTVFDKWVEYMMGIGITKEITCYSLVPWHLSFQYFDQASNSFKSIQTKPGAPEFEQHWLGMLQSFAKHLKEKGWFDITHISMDERPMEAMIETMKVIRKADPDFKVSMAGVLHPEIEGDLDSYSIAMRYKWSEEQKAQRKEAGKVSTFYTCCEEAYPNTFTFSAPAESEWLGWFAANMELDGYLRWALNSWVKSPLQDSRFTAWAAGDTYMIYPGGRSSIRYERLISGIQAYEKIRLLKEEYARKNDQSSLRKLNKILAQFNEETLTKTPAEETVRKANALLQQL
ncbi:MAG: DUF4091 domain-containing protein [Bacteroidales bacterium]